ncbi:hypothetical protein ACVNPX_09290 [Staphylococcus aureus]
MELPTLPDIFNITIGQTFSGGFIDFLLFGVLQGNSKTNYLYVIPIEICGSVVDRFQILNYEI